MQEWEAYHEAASHKEPIAAKHAAPGWAKIWYYERDSSPSSEASQLKSSKTLGATDLRGQMSDLHDTDREVDWIESIRSYVCHIKT